MSEIYLITYDRPHRKTQDLLLRYNLRGIRPVLVVTPYKEFTKRPVPLYDLSPGEPIGVSEYHQMIDHSVIMSEDLPTNVRYVIGGCQLLPESFVVGREIFNAHPGVLPYVRGLDSIKWAILNSDSPIGYTIHIIDEKVDWGLFVMRRLIDISPNDTIHTISRKIYDGSLNDLVVTSLESTPPYMRIEGNDKYYPPTKRMPTVLERHLDSALSERTRKAVL